MPKALIFIFSLIIISFPFTTWAQEKIPDEDVKTWTQKAAASVMTFGFHNYDKKLIENRKFFTLEGYQNFMIALSRSKTIENVHKNQSIINAKVMCFPRITKQEKESWTLMFPFSKTYSNSAGDDAFYSNAEMTVKYDENVENDMHLGIVQWVETTLSKEEAEKCDPEEQKKAKIGQLQREIEWFEEQIEKNRKKIEKIKLEQKP